MGAMTWWLADCALHLLEPDEREAVRGDLIESGVPSGQALLEVLGLVARRQARLWTDWRPWLGLVGLVIPLGMMLSLTSRAWAHHIAIYAWLYADNWTWGYLDSPGARRDLVTYIAGFLVMCVTLLSWAWTMGFVLGRLSRRTIWVNGALFGVVLFAGTLGSTTAGLHYNGNDAVFSMTFYRVALPVTLRIVLVLLPALLGMQRGLRLVALPVWQTAGWAVVVTTLTILMAQGLEGSVMFGWQSLTASAFSAPSPWPGRWQLVMLPLTMVWPAGYLVATASWQWWHHRTATG